MIHRDRGPGALWPAALTIAVVLIAWMGGSAAQASAADNGIARTPPMGWSSWDVYRCTLTAPLIMQAADAMVADGMKAAGYRYVNIDDCWMAPSRDTAGNLQADPVKFPDGIQPVAEYVHRLGLSLGIYEDAGTQTCAGLPGSYGHEAQDAATFASWGVDYLKYDQCSIPLASFPGQTHQQIEQALYARMSDALKATGRPIVFAMSNGADPTTRPWLWGSSIANLWRTTGDLEDSFDSLVSNFESTVRLYRYAGPGHWNDPDLLEVGNGGSSDLEYLTEFSLWAEMAAPLIASTNLDMLSSADLAILENPDVIAVDQDPLGAPGVPISSRNGRWVLSKRLRGGDRAVLLFNATDTATTLRATAVRAGLPRTAVYRLRALWRGNTSETTGEISAFVPAHGVAIVRVSELPRRRADRLPPSTVLALGAHSPQLCRGQSTIVTEKLTDNGVTPLAEPRLSLTAPPGWKVKAVRRRVLPALVPAGRELTTRFRVTAPATTSRTSRVVLTGAASYAAVDGRHRSRVTLSEPLCPPVSRAAAA